MRWRITVWLVAVLAAGLVVAAIVMLSQRPVYNEVTMADGKVLRLEKAVYGKRSNFQQQLTWPEKLKSFLASHLPRQWFARIITPTPGGMGSWWMNTTVHTNTDALHVYLTCRDPVTGLYYELQNREAKVVDEHGCEFSATQSGGGSAGPSPGGPGMTAPGYFSYTWFTFEAFPRHEKNFKLHLYEGRKATAEFTLPNPAPQSAPRASWKVEDLPITRQPGDASFTLDKLALKTNRYGEWTSVSVNPTFVVKERGEVSSEWNEVDFDVWDSSGNFASKMNGSGGALCRWEPAWKLLVRFFGTEKARTASNEVWTIRGLKAPVAGEFTALTGSNRFGPVSIELIALAGPGTVVYSNDVAIRATVLENSRTRGSTSGSSSSYSRGMYVRTDTVQSPVAQLALRLTGMTVDERLTVRAVDDQGRPVYAGDSVYEQVNPSNRTKPKFISKLYGQATSYFTLNLHPDSTTVDLVFVVHHAHVEEFIFKPPGPVAP